MAYYGKNWESPELYPPLTQCQDAYGGKLMQIGLRMVHTANMADGDSEEFLLRVPVDEYWYIFPFLHTLFSLAAGGLIDVVHLRARYDGTPNRYLRGAAPTPLATEPVITDVAIPDWKEVYYQTGMTWGNDEYIDNDGNWSQLYLPPRTRLSIAIELLVGVPGTDWPANSSYYLFVHVVRYAQRQDIINAVQPSIRLPQAQ